MGALEERENVTVKNLQIDGFQLGIGLYSSNDISISGIAINANAGDGISLYNSSGTIISGSNIESNTGSGIYLDSSSGNTISGNNVSSNAASGIYHYSSSGTTILGNNVTNNMVGIDLVSPSDNSIYHNNFVSNGVQVYVDSVNVWDDGYPSGANYWSDYSTKYPNSSEVDNSGARISLNQPKIVTSSAKRVCSACQRVPAITRLHQSMSLIIAHALICSDLLPKKRGQQILLSGRKKKRELRGRHLTRSPSVIGSSPIGGATLNAHLYYCFHNSNPFFSFGHFQRLWEVIEFGDDSHR